MLCARLTITDISPKADDLDGAEKAENQNLVGEIETKAETSGVPPPPPDGNGDALFAAVTNLNDHPTTLYAALPPRTTLLLFYGHGDPALDVHAHRMPGGVSNKLELVAGEQE